MAFTKFKSSCTLEVVIQIQEDASVSRTILPKLTNWKCSSMKTLRNSSSVSMKMIVAFAKLIPLYPPWNLIIWWVHVIFPRTAANIYQKTFGDLIDWVPPVKCPTSNIEQSAPLEKVRPARRFNGCRSLTFEKQSSHELTEQTPCREDTPDEATTEVITCPAMPRPLC